MLPSLDLRIVDWVVSMAAQENMQIKGNNKMDSGHPIYLSELSSALTFARDQVRAVAQRVEVVSRKEVRIRGLRSELLRTLTAASGVEAAVLGVRAFEPKWRARNDSNVRPSNS